VKIAQRVREMGAQPDRPTYAGKRPLLIAVPEGRLGVPLTDLIRTDGPRLEIDSCPFPSYGGRDHELEGKSPTLVH
jgi:hypothetical protein